MPGSQADEIDWENLSNKELHDKFQQMMTEQVQDVLNNFEEAMERSLALRRRSKQSSITSLMNCSRVFHHHHPLHLTHLSNNNNNDYLHVAKQTSAEQAVFLLRLAKLLVLLLILLWLLLLMRRRMIMWEIMRMRLIKINTTCSHLYHHQQVDLRYIFVMVGLHHHLRYEMMSIFLN